MTEFVLNRGSRQLTFKMVNSHPICPFNRTPVKRILSSFQNGISVSLQDGTTGGGSASSFDRDAGKTSSSGSSSRSFDMDTDQSSDQDQHQEVGNAPTEPNAPKRRERKEIKDPIRFRQVLFLNTKEMMKETDKISRMQGDANPNKPMPAVEEKKNKKDKKDATPTLPSELDPNQLYSPAYIAVAVDAKKPEDTKKDTKGPTRKPIKNLPGPETRDGQAKDQPGQNPHGTISKLKDMLIPIGSRPRPMSILAEPLYSDPAEFLAATGTPLLPPQRIDPHKSNQTINKAKDTKNNKKLQSGTVTQTNTQRGASNSNNSPQSTNKMSIVDQLAATLTRGNQIEGSPQSTTKRLRATGGT
ncbi:MAG: hypothetical protein EZS28_030693 [Streblomastix strix]|uniref:Uncharacterized protein n=1 Tax=Streblomastix strix TaxID=222440 RepID=A0A5J4UUC8_9EUKA|nr:MAG: hypothetical protein EZS28_030693 [Streblomastix strix]